MFIFPPVDHAPTGALPANDSTLFTLDDGVLPPDPKALALDTPAEPNPCLAVDKSAVSDHEVPFHVSVTAVLLGDPPP